MVYVYSVDNIDGVKIEDAISIGKRMIREAKDVNVDRNIVDIAYIDTCAGDHV